MSRRSLVTVAAAGVLVSTAQAQFNNECGVGETQLYVKVGGTDRLTKCKDYFDVSTHSTLSYAVRHIHLDGHGSDDNYVPTSFLRTDMA